MWKVKHEELLRVYQVTDTFIKDVLDWANNNPGVFQNQIINSISTQPLKKVASRCPKLQKKLFLLANSSYAPTIKNAYNHATLNYDSILNGITTFRRLSNNAIEIVYEVFDYLYKELIDTKIFWEQYGDGTGEVYTKDKYRVLVGALRGYCPYCDFNSILTTTSSNNDHFFPISYHPILGIFWKNLSISCMACNLSIKNDKHPSLPILHPYNDQPADNMHFTFDEANETISISINNTLDGHSLRATKNFIALFDLEKTYSSAWKYVKRIENELFKNAIKRQADKNDLQEFIDNFKKELEILKGNLIPAKGNSERSKLLLDFCDFLEGKIDYFELTFKQNSVPDELVPN